jgi:3-dehydroquinate dehydratase / shikimate dehydrogenase
VGCKNMDSVQLVAAVTSPPLPGAIRKLPESVSWLQIRADLTGDISPAWLRNHFSGKLLYTLRSRNCAGTFEGTCNERRSRLIAAATDYDLIELDAQTDLSLETIRHIPAEKRLIFHRTTACTASQLYSTFQEMACTPARLYWLASASSKTSDGLQPLLFLKQLGRTDVVASSEGLFGLWSRLLTPYFGTPFLFGRLEQSGSRAEDLTAERLVSDYGFPVLAPLQKLYGIAGNPVFQSLSPRLHNAGYRAINYPALFVPFHVECFEDFYQEMLEGPSLPSLGIPIKGVTIISPHKEVALAAAGESSSMVRKAVSTNIFMRKNGGWKAETTDPESIAAVTHKSGNGRERPRAAVIGCGGAGRAVAAALKEAGAEVTLVNRSRDRGNRAGLLLGLPFVSLAEFRAAGFTLLVNATPIGQQNDGPPFAIESLNSDVVIVDLAYGAKPTPLVSGTLARGGTVVDGYDVLLSQVRKQFRLMVGREMPHGIGRELGHCGRPNGDVKKLQMASNEVATPPTAVSVWGKTGESASGLE